VLIVLLLDKDKFVYPENSGFAVWARSFESGQELLRPKTKPTRLGRVGV
jgi:hypothetical protein